jgi:protein O-GlcNAc transferase
VDQTEPSCRESRLLIACTSSAGTEQDEAAIRQMLGQEIDWTSFAQAAVDRGLVSLMACNLVRAAPDLVPAEILDALRKIVAETQSRNRDALEVVARTAEAHAIGQSAAAIRRACTAARNTLLATPNNAQAWRKLGRELIKLRRYEAARRCYDRVLELEPEDAVNWTDRANALSLMGLAKLALADTEKALALDPREVRAWIVRARVLLLLRHFGEAVKASDHTLAHDADNAAAVRVGIQARLFACDWSRREADKRLISEGMKLGRMLINPLHHRAVSDSEAEQRILARLRAASVPKSTKPLWRGERYCHDRIRIAYISTDFRDHAVGHAIVGCLEEHDRTRFETTAISLGPNDGGALRRRIEAAFDRFIDARTISDAEAGEIIRDLEIDIAIDLNGYSGESRSGILALRPAPVQVNYFGYPGTMSVPFIDYILADPWLIPSENRSYYSEQVVYLPYTYLPSDRKRPLAAAAANRAEAGLPETGFVFAAFHNAFKIGPEIFDLWTRLLHNVEKSVLWLLEDNADATRNLRHEAKLRGIEPERLVFAPRKRLPDHLARLSLGDLFLDVLPYNAHTSASDALWAGLPVLTCPGKTFAGRVAAALMHAIGLPELVASSLPEYEHIALALAHDPDRLARIRVRLMHNRETEPLFDTTRFTLDLETAYRTMWERQQAGLPAAGFSVTLSTSAKA